MQIRFIMIYFSYILFLISIITYEFYQYDFTLFIRTSNTTALIERALDGIPTCNSHDRRRQRALLHTLEAWTHLAHSHHIRYWISHRTLLALHEQQNILPDENEIDVTILAKETPQLFPLQQANFSSIYQLQIHPQWMMVRASNRSYFPSEGIHFKMPNARCIHRLYNTSINIWPIYEKYPYNGVLIESDRDERWISTAEEWIFPLRPCRLSGIKMWCPARPKFLAALTGKREFVYCSYGRWIRSNRQMFDV